MAGKDQLMHHLGEGHAPVALTGLVTIDEMIATIFRFRQSYEKALLVRAEGMHTDQELNRILELGFGPIR